MRKRTRAFVAALALTLTGGATVAAPALAQVDADECPAIVVGALPDDWQEDLPATLLEDLERAFEECAEGFVPDVGIPEPPQLPDPDIFQIVRDSLNLIPPLVGIRLPPFTLCPPFCGRGDIATDHSAASVNG